MAAYGFVTHWSFDAPLIDVFNALDAAERYQEWWPAIVEYKDLTPERHGLGARAERVVRGVLPYTLRYMTTVTTYDPPHEIAYDAVGDLNGNGRFVLIEESGRTHVTFYWDVQTSGFWLNLLAPLLKPLFAWNHNWVMAQGERGLAKWLQQGATGAGERERRLSKLPLPNRRVRVRPTRLRTRCETRPLP